MNPLASDSRIPTAAQLASLAADIRAFVADARINRRTAWFGNDYTVCRFELSFCETPHHAALNHILLAPGWRGHGVFTGLIDHLRSIPGIEEVAVIHANSEEIQHRLRKLGFHECADRDYIWASGASRRAPAAKRATYWLHSLFARLFARFVTS